MRYSSYGIKGIIVLVGIVLIAGCSTLAKVTVYPIQKDDIYMLPAGSTIVIPAGSVLHDDKGRVSFTYEVEETHRVAKEGCVLSKFYINEIMDARIK